MSGIGLGLCLYVERNSVFNLVFQYEVEFGNGSNSSIISKYFQIEFIVVESFFKENVLLCYF